jgi:hypothetical protein
MEATPVQDLEELWPDITPNTAAPEAQVQQEMNQAHRKVFGKLLRLSNTRVQYTREGQSLQDVLDNEKNTQTQLIKDINQLQRTSKEPPPLLSSPSFTNKLVGGNKGITFNDSDVGSPATTSSAPKRRHNTKATNRRGTAVLHSLRCLASSRDILGKSQASDHPGAHLILQQLEIQQRHRLKRFKQKQKLTHGSTQPTAITRQTGGGGKRSSIPEGLRVGGRATRQSIPRQTKLKTRQRKESVRIGGQR